MQTHVLGIKYCFDYQHPSSDGVCTDIISRLSSPLIVLPYSLLCLDCWSSRFSVFIRSSLYLYSNSLAFSATSVRGNDRNGNTRTIRNVPHRMNPPHHAPIHSGSPGRILTSKLNISTQYCNNSAPSPYPKTGPRTPEAQMKATMKGYHSKSYIQKHTYCDYYHHIKLIWHLGKGCIQILKAYGPIFEPVSLHIDI